jgi:hypothetical protein
MVGGTHDATVTQLQFPKLGAQYWQKPVRCLFPFNTAGTVSNLQLPTTLFFQSAARQAKQPVRVNNL